ncbi:MAG: stalk domain-containing protein [Clostridiales bacterium]|nr:stalk domain-containing protein [Clostridiales bacterium]
MKKYIAGILTGIILIWSTLAFAATNETISVIFDYAKLVVNGEMTDTSTMLYDGRIYIQLRGVSEVFDAELEWDNESKTAYLTTADYVEEETAPEATAQDSETYANLYESVQGETNANAAYLAFAEQARNDGFLVVARLFQATADAEAKHAEDEWAILQTLGATQRPVASKPVVGSTEENLQAAFNGETYEYEVMYPGFVATAEAEGMNAGDTNARRIFNLARQAEEIHAGNYLDVFTNLANTDYIDSKYGVIYRCPVCGEVVIERPGRCPICNADGANFIEYSDPLSAN